MTKEKNNSEPECVRKKDKYVIKKLYTLLKIKVRHFVESNKHLLHIYLDKHEKHGSCLVCSITQVVCFHIDFLTM